MDVEKAMSETQKILSFSNFVFNPKTFSMLADKVVEQKNKQSETDTFTNHIPK